MEKAILHIDGDSFFASCEVSVNHKLRGKPVVTGQERGIASAMSKEAKALGVSRGMPIFQIRKIFPQVIVLKSNFRLYEIFAQRMFGIVRRFSPLVEPYSIDECFAVIEGDDLLNLSAVIKSTLEKELGITFSLGVAPTKVLAKLASSKYKPNALTYVPKDSIEDFLSDIDIGSVWGIGPSTAKELREKNINTALDLAKESRGVFSKRVREIRHELLGSNLFPIGRVGEASKSVQSTSTFYPPSNDRERILSELSMHIELAYVKVRRAGLFPKKIFYFLKTQEYRYHRHEIQLPGLMAPPDILDLISDTLSHVYRPSTLYRATGVTLASLVPIKQIQRGLFSQNESQKWTALEEVLSALDGRYGSRSVVLGSSLRALKYRGGIGFHKYLEIPYIGEVY